MSSYTIKKEESDEEGKSDSLSSKKRDAPDKQKKFYPFKRTNTNVIVEDDKDIKYDKKKKRDPMKMTEQKFIRDDWGEEEPSSEEDRADEKENPKRVRCAEQFNKGGGKMYGGVVEFENVYNNFESMDTQTFRNRFEPPHVVDLDDEELQEVTEYINKRIKNKREIWKDMMNEFIVLVSGMAKIPLNRIYQGSATPQIAQYPRAEAPISAISGAGAATGTVLTPVRRSDIFLSPPRMAVNTNRPGSRIPPPTGPPPPIAAPRVNPEDERATRLALEKREEYKYGNSLRIASAYSWTEKPEVIGLISIAPEVYAAAMRAFVNLRSIDKFSTFRELENFNPIIYSEIPDVRILFAEITSFFIARSNFIFPSRVPLDKMGDRINVDLWISMMKMSKFSWDSTTEHFVCSDRAYTTKNSASSSVYFPIRN
jgi:hypothetical protein